MTWNHWNYRVVHRACPSLADLPPEESYTIHECFYDENGLRTAISVDGIEARGETIEELREDLEMMMRAFDEPVLEYDIDELEQS